MLEIEQLVAETSFFKDPEPGDDDDDEKKKEKKKEGEKKERKKEVDNNKIQWEDSPWKLQANAKKVFHNIPKKKMYCLTFLIVFNRFSFNFSTNSIINDY